MRTPTGRPGFTGSGILPDPLDVVQDVSGLGVRCYAVPRRYAAAPLAEQLIGYLDSEGHGAAGLEAALDDVLYTGERDTLHCAVTAQGRLQRGSEPILEKADSAPQGVRLTLSRSIQRAAEGVAAESMATGCILIIDVSSGKVRACVSLPGFDAANVGESLTAPDSPLLNRAFSAYAVGSVFKPVLAAAALEAGEGDFIRECPGYDALNGQVYRSASWGWTALWKRAATATLSSWGVNWGRSVSGRWRQRWASGRDRTLQTASGQLLAFCPKQRHSKTRGSLPTSASDRGSFWRRPYRWPG